jgi:acyl carrier protein
MTGNDRGITDRVLELARAALLNSEVKATDNIFEVGGDSLTFLEICAEIEDEFDIEIPLESVWATSSIAEFAVVVEECLRAKDAEPLPSANSAGY